MENKDINEKVISEHFKEILEKGLKIDLNNPNFKETPERIARAYKEIFVGIEHIQRDIKKMFTKSFPTNYKGIILEKNITVFSMCPHHLLPVKYNISVGYIPNGSVIGLSKLARVIELLAKKPELQETFTEEIVNLLEKNLHTKGVICMVKGDHYCMQMRGVKHKEVSTITSAAKGIFLDQPEMELKFYNLIRNS